MSAKYAVERVSMVREIIVCVFLFYHSICDVKTRKIYIPACIIFGIAGFIVFAMGSRRHLFSLACGILCGVCLIIIAYLSEEAVGIGDGCVVTAVGIWIGGGKTLATLMGGLCLAAGFGILRMCLGKANGKTELAFIPFFTFAYVCLTLGNII